MGLFSGIKKIVKKVAKPALSLAGIATGNPYLSFGSELLGGMSDQKHSMDMANMDANLQREFAQNGIRWRVNDAISAGLHPLAALGMQPASASPVYGNVGDSGFSDATRNLGQNLSRMTAASQTREERQQQSILSTLTLEKAGLENDLLRSQIARLNQSPVSAFPSSDRGQLIPGQANATDLMPVQRSFDLERGTNPDAAYIRTKNGVAVVPGEVAKQRIEDSPMEFSWLLRNQVLPAFDPSRRPNLPNLREGYRWSLNPFTGEYTVKNKFGWRPKNRKFYYNK